MSRFLLFLFFFTCLILPLVSPAQDDDVEYVLPDDETSKDKRATVRLPIKGKPAEEQYYVPSYARDSDTSDDHSGEDIDQLPENGDKKVEVGLEMGSSFSSDFKGGSAITTYVAPNIRYRLSHDLVLRTGVMASQSYFNGWTNYRLDGSAFPSSLTSTMVFAGLDYQLNEKVLLYGTVFKTVGSYPSGYGYDKQLDGFGYTVGMEYKISEKSFLQIQIQRNSGYSPFMPYSSGYGFGSQPFSFFR